MLKETSEKLEGNDQFEGFGIELIDELSKKLGFSYTWRLQEDNKYGGIDPKTGEWNGMLREIIDSVSSGEDCGVLEAHKSSPHPLLCGHLNQLAYPMFVLRGY